MSGAGVTWGTLLVVPVIVQSPAGVKAGGLAGRAEPEKLRTIIRHPVAKA
jgi:hypothetical protein